MMTGDMVDCGQCVENGQGLVSAKLALSVECIMPLRFWADFQKRGQKQGMTKKKAAR
jgi:hypothetical protein